MSGQERAAACWKCGHAIQEGASFCPNCGSPLNVASPPAPKKDDLSGALFGGGVLILLGITFWLATSGAIDWGIWWAYFLSGLGILLVLFGALKARSGKDAGSMTGGVVLFAIGAISIYAWHYPISGWWPLILVLLGLLIIASAVLGRKIVRR